MIGAEVLQSRCGAATLALSRCIDAATGPASAARSAALWGSVISADAGSGGESVGADSSAGVSARVLASSGGVCERAAASTGWFLVLRRKALEDLSLAAGDGCAVLRPGIALSTCQHACQALTGTHSQL